MKNHIKLIERYLPGSTGGLSGNVLAVPTAADAIGGAIRRLREAGLPFLTMVATDERAAAGGFRIYYVFGVPAESAFIAPYLALPGTSFPSLAAEFPALALYEREVMTLFGLAPTGHPDPRTLILHEENWPTGRFPLRKDFKNGPVAPIPSGTYRFNTVGGEGVYEIPVGPVHAGIIEPGHFRFSVLGEEIVALEARLGWVHKGAEKLFEELPLEKKVSLAEHISGDSAFSHALAFSQALENLTGTTVPERARYLRVIFGELERLTMHLFDIGNIGGNGTGYSFMAAHCFRLVEELRRLSEHLSGSRFLRDLATPGGVAKDLAPEAIGRIRAVLAKLSREFADIVAVARASASFANRIKGTGVVPASVVSDYAGAGIAARSVGLKKDARIEYPYAAYQEIKPEIQLTEGGDVEARFYIRVKEVEESLRLIEQALQKLPVGSIVTTLKPLPTSGNAMGVVEGWRGEIVYFVQAAEGVISRVKVRDPSFIHWQFFSHLSSTDMVPDFPLINKSFNLSYSGNDL